MTLAVRISARAALQIDAAARWWQANRPSAPGAVRKDIASALQLLAEQPGIGSPYESARVSGVRRLLIGRIRYFVYYRVTADSIDVLAIWHVSRIQRPNV